MCPNELKLSCQFSKAVCVGSVKPLVDFPRVAWESKFAAYVRACAAASHRVKNILRLKVGEQILDEFASAVAGIFAVASRCLSFVKWKLFHSTSATSRTPF